MFDRDDPLLPFLDKIKLLWAVVPDEHILRAALRSSSTVVRQWAVEECEPQVPASLELLALALDDPALRVDAVDMLAQRTDLAAIPVLIKALDVVEHDSVRSIIKTLGSMGSVEAVEPLSQIVENASDFKLRNAAIVALKQIRGSIAQTEEWKSIVEAMRSREREKAKRAGAPAQQPQPESGDE